MRNLFIQTFICSWFIMVQHRGSKALVCVWIPKQAPEWAALHHMETRKTSEGSWWKRGITPSKQASPQDTHTSLGKNKFTDEWYSYKSFGTNFIILLLQLWVWKKTIIRYRNKFLFDCGKQQFHVMITFFCGALSV